MPDNAILVPVNDYDAATLTVGAGSMLEGFELVNSQLTRRRHARSSGLTLTVRGAWTESRTTNCISLHRTLLYGASFQLKLYTSASWSSLALDTGAVAIPTYTTTADAYTFSTGTKDLKAVDSPSWAYYAATAAQSFEIVFSGTPTFFASGYDFSRVWIGKYHEFAVNPDLGMTLGIRDLGGHDRTVGGSVIKNTGNSWRQLRFDLNRVDEGERSLLLDMLRQVGMGGEVWASIFPGEGGTMERDHCVAGVLVSLPDMARQVSWLTQTIVIAEQ